MEKKDVSPYNKLGVDYAASIVQPVFIRGGQIDHGHSVARMGHGQDDKEARPREIESSVAVCATFSQNLSKKASRRVLWVSSV